MENLYSEFGRTQSTLIEHLYFPDILPVTNWNNQCKYLLDCVLENFKWYSFVKSYVAVMLLEVDAQSTFK